MPDDVPDGLPEVVADLHDVRVVVDRIEGRSVCGMCVGDSFEVTESSRLRLPNDRHFCIYAVAAVLPMLAALQRPGAPGDWITDGLEVACPDPHERVIMRIERTEQRRLDRSSLV